MDYFYIVAGIASILSLVISIIAIRKAINIENKTVINNSTESKQSIKSKKMNDSNLIQVGRDKK